MAPVAQAATSVVTVRPSDTQGWGFNPDPANSTPYEFTNAQASIGSGSLYVLPIGTNAADKFIATKTLGVPTSDVSSVAYDFKIAGNGTSASANQFYLNVYTNLPGSTTYYDCRFDYAPTSGSISSFTTASFDANSTPTIVKARGAATCPTTLAAMPSGSTAKFIALNVGDTSTSDAGLAGYLDKVVVTTTSDSTTYDFETDLTYPKTKDECKKDAWKTFTGGDFKNQGQCVSFVASNDKARNDMSNTPTF
ncbi:MAG: hypothetical protein ABIS59_00365 [Candidatus Saccharibacteria bacterium]